MVAMPDFDAVEAGFGEVVDDGGEVGGIFAAELDGVGDGGEAAGFVDAVDGLARGEAFLGEEGGAGGAEVDVEGLLDGGDAVGADEGLGDVGAADDDGSAGGDFFFGDGFDLSHGDFAAELVEACDDLGVAIVAGVEEDFGHLVEGGGGGVDEVAEDVEGARGGVIGGDFDAGDEADDWMAASAAASARPLPVSWSVRAMPARPAALAARMRSVGEKVPSEAVEWVWRSTNMRSP